MTMRDWWYVLLCGLVAAKQRRSIPIYVLAGDDNVEGFASISHLKSLSAEFPHWSTLDTVPNAFVAYEHRGSWEYGPLDFSYGHNRTTFGPEMEFGRVLSRTTNDPVVILKVSGQSLAGDLQSPRSGRPGKNWARLLSSLTKVVQPKFLGELVGLPKVRPDLRGVVWWQGYPDLIGKNKDYESQLTNWILDLQDAWGEDLTGYLPIYVVQLAGMGRNASSAEIAFRQMQRRVVNATNFTHWVAVEQYSNDEDPQRDDYVHYYGRADTMLHVGGAMAQAVIAEDDWAGELPTEAQMEDRAHGFFDLGIGSLALILFGIVFGGAYHWHRHQYRLQTEDWEEEDEKNHPAVEFTDHPVRNVV